MSVATKLSKSITEATELVSQQDASAQSEISIGVELSKAQRRYLAEICPDDAHLFACEKSGMQVVELPIDRMIELAASLEKNKMTESGSRKNAASKALKAIEKATLRHCKALTAVDTVYRIRIELDRVEPAIWRQIEIPNCTLFELHEAIQVAVGWEDDHMFAFTIDGDSFFGSPMGGLTCYGQGESAEDYLLVEVISHKIKTFEYEYDFGDSWRHTITVEAATVKPIIGAAKCLGGENACPPEDCGGVYGFYQLLEAIRDPERRPEDDELLEIYEGFDPSFFSVELATARLKCLF